MSAARKKKQTTIETSNKNKQQLRHQTKTKASLYQKQQYRSNVLASNCTEWTTEDQKQQYSTNVLTSSCT